MTTAGAATPNVPPERSLPRWFWFLPAIAIVTWWPIHPYWQSDDFLALHYAQDFGRVLHDFVGPQYGATDTWWFYRPLITFSFWLDLQLGGVTSQWSFWSNVLAHAISTLLVGLIWRRLLGDPRGFCAGLLWATMPSHIGSIAWAVGRVDSHTTVFCLTTLWLCQRSQRQRRTPGLIALTTTIALMQKELAMILPPLATLLLLLPSTGTGMRDRLSHALRITAPAWLVLALYLPFRCLVLGRFGGYAAAAYDPMPMLQGFGTAIGNLAVPLRWIGTPEGAWQTWWLWSAAVPVLIAVLLAVRARGPRFVLGTAMLFVVASAPMAAIFASADNPHTLRNYYLPTVALAGLLAAGGRAVTLAVLTAWLWPLIAARTEQHEVDRGSAQMHQALLRAADEGAGSPMFVAGLPHASRHGIAVQLHFGIDRLLLPPFGSGRTQLYALRPLLEMPGVVRLSPADAPPWSLPEGSTWFFPDATALGRAPAPANLPALKITGDDDGIVDFTTPRLELLEQNQQSFALTTDVRPQGFRMTVFTANGYLSHLLENHSRPQDADGRIDARTLLAGEQRGDHRILPALFALQDNAFFGNAMMVPTTVDLVPEFPVLLEAGTLSPQWDFVATHRATRLLRFRFDRGYPAWVRRVQGPGP